MTKRTDIDAAPFGFAVLRTPLLPFDELAAWGEGLEAPAAGDDGGELAAALERDRERLRERLRAAIERPEVREALFVASPSLVDGLDRWRGAPDGKRGRGAEESLVRYFLRMTARPTPFGLFSGCSLVEVGEATELRLGPRGDYRRTSRLDMDYVFRLQDDLGRDPALRRALTYRPNTSLYRAAGRLRYAEAQLRGGSRAYHLVAIDPDPFLDAVLAAARDGAGYAELVDSLVAADPDGEVDADEAAGFVDELIDNQLLVCDLEPVVTGTEAAEGLRETLHRAGAPAALTAPLDAAAAAIEELDRAGLGNPPERYRAVAATLAELPTEVRLARLFQVDMTKPAAGASLGREVLEELRRGVALLARLSGKTPNDEMLDRFRRDFVERWGPDRPVPLVAALDAEAGIGFDGGRGADASPLLEGLDLAGAGAGTAPERPTWGPLEQRLAGRVAEALAAGAAAVEITDDELGEPAGEAAPPLCDAFEVMATVAARSSEALAGGDFRVLLRSVFGPTGGRLLGRFCHTEPALEERVRELLRAEEALEPDADFAEIVHLPEGRTGNIVWRPVLRGLEIPYLGRSGAPPERRLPIGDLLVSVTGSTIVLRSAASGRRILPRLTNAHNFSGRGMGVYRFLCALQSQGVRSGFAWRWGALEAFPYLPRVTSGRLVLSRARWALDAAEIAGFGGGDAARYAAVRRWRRRRGVPRWVVLPEGDHELVLDLDNPLAVDAFVGQVRGRRRVLVVELFPGAGELCVAGPEGRYSHEVLVPFVRRREPKRAALRSPIAAARPGEAPARTFPPGSEWLYAKLYTGTATADRVLRHVVPRVVPPALASGAADRWFFLRYGDPDWHLRLRLHGDPEGLHREVLPLLEAAVAPLVADGQVWKVELGTYEREVERYGGPAGIELAERIFHADSDAVLALLGLLEGDATADLVWRLALVGVDRLLADLGLRDEAAIDVLARMQHYFALEHRLDAGLKKQLSTRLRREQEELAGLLDAGDDPAHPLAPALAAFRRRSQALAPVVAELAAGVAAGRVALPVAELAPSYAHMFVNRLLRAEGRAHELVLYDFLLRLSRGRRMRARALAESRG